MTRWLSLLLFCLLCSTSALAETYRGNVSWIYDGDTIKVEGIGKIRLIGIDTPEKTDSPRDDYYLRQGRLKRETLRQIGHKAFEFNMHEVRNRRVKLEFDHQRTDTYGRTLAYVFLPDGRLLNQVLLNKGLAAVYRRFDFVRKADFLRAEQSARDRHLGLWQNSK
ncbi:thermonuclease family protein [Geopsychrobacter electrodiphilus]|uniref:thermonuclease family protein n=1 Tax=Geopsychrobacter electrodiphilus TaxID=225196 RepID=UPI00036B39AF|nr:thermonuclease family protein [Geopsychrobacter electrodiphilus]